jgi:hypothetical protein
MWATIGPTVDELPWLYELVHRRLVKEHFCVGRHSRSRRNTPSRHRSGSTAIDLVHGLRDQWVAVRPVVAPARDEPDAHGIAPRHEPKTIVLIW